ncbi:sensor histidine kinase [Pullulanibacillus camelliae]|uniref:sensor histidine kinase n=1 Tax=Pullulanibacillus camelliae TaxID=1707096 RepID=UPI001E4CA4D3|nr:sensor histidine kinase [Pullulanibacillus camelliae]
MKEKRTKITGRILPKMIIGYIFLVFIPVVLFGVILYERSYNNIMQNYSQSNQSLINQAANNLRIGLAQVNSIYSLFQYNPSVTGYLNGQYQTVSNQVYTYLKNIRPMLTFAYSGDKAIESIKLFKMKKNVFPIENEIEDMDAIHSPAIKRLVTGLKVGQGEWRPSPKGNQRQLPQLTYYKKIYNDIYTEELAVMQVTFNDNLLNKFLKAVNVNHDSHVLIVANGKPIYKSTKFPFTNQEVKTVMHQLHASKQPNWIWKQKELLVNSLNLEDLHLNIYFFSPTDQVFKDIRQKAFIYGFVFLMLLGLLSSIYYMIASVLTKRVLNLARHMRKVDENKLSIYKGDKGNDEIGFLTESYNALIQRIDELINKVHRAELRKKEADYLVLQAQVNPHFLYNTLEAIRMLAEMNDDHEVVEAMYTLSKLLRYSLSSGGNITTLEKEIENIRDYLKIHKLRMMDRLQYEIVIDAAIHEVHCPRFILQPLVENCIHHGLSTLRKPGQIKVMITEKGEDLKIEIADNGKGITEERLAVIHGVMNNTLERSLLETKHTGLGIYNVSERVKAYFGVGSTLDIVSEPGQGTSYIMLIKRDRGKAHVEAHDCR